MSSMEIVIPGRRPVHDGLGNILAPTITDPTTGQIVSQPVHTVPEYIGKLLLESKMGAMAPEQSAEPSPAPEPTPTPEPAPVASPEPPAAAPAPEGGDVGGVEVGIAEAEAEAAPETEEKAAE